MKVAITILATILSVSTIVVILASIKYFIVTHAEKKNTRKDGDVK